MSDPMTNQRPVDPPPPPPEVVQRKSASPLIWILLLIALIAFAWYFYNRNGGTGTSPDMTPPPATSDAMTPNASDSPEKTPAKVKKPAKPDVVAKAASRSREVALIGNPKPSYPPEAFRAGEEGTVVVMADVDANGDVSSATLADRSGSRILDRAAVSEVRRWKFQPAMKSGKAIASSVRVPVDYKLANGKQ